uniref:(California timema) hypothetical protein n=1 Tax=Timema californicum TaxID=61474 RepID=A0A7R9PA34_TIMCA|nr:unnamed protein product [Timema californicum]
MARDVGRLSYWQILYTLLVMHSVGGSGSGKISVQQWPEMLGGCPTVRYYTPCWSCTLLVVAALAAPSSDLDIVALEPLTRYMPVLEDAPKYPGSRIVNGNQASRGQFPHQAALYLDGRSFCGGSLISTSWILTAAHCTLNIGTVTAHLGAQSLNSVESGRVTLATRNLINHASYNPSNLNNDISLVRLPSAVALNAFIQLVHLPRHSQASTTYAGVATQVSGWGRNSDSATGVSNNLNFVNLNIITNAVCAQTYGTAVIVGSTICASGAGGRSTCNGDSGGPLVLNQASGYLQIGVVSFVSGAGCASGNPSGYVRTGHFLSWISANTGIAIAN